MVRPGSTPCSLRPATDADRAELYRIHRRAMREYVEAVWGWDEAVQERMFDENFDPARRRVIERAGRTIGFLDVDESPDRILLATIEIDPAHQNRGVGTGLIRDLLEQAAARRLPVELQVLKATPARGLYERLGFERTGETGTHFLMRIDATGG